MGEEKPHVAPQPPNTHQYVQEEDPLKKYEDFMNNLKQNMSLSNNGGAGGMAAFQGQGIQAPGQHIPNNHDRMEQLAASQINEPLGAPPREFDYLDYQDNERRLQELTSQNASLMKYRNMLGFNNNNNNF